MRWFALAFGACVCVCACASAGGQDNTPRDGTPGDDATPIDAEIDAPSIDAAPQMVTLSQNTSTVVGGGSFACSMSNFTRENSYYRVFALTDHNVPGAFQVQMVTFGVQTADAGTGTSQAGQVKIGRYMGTAGGSSIDLAQVVPINSKAITIPDSGTSAVNVSITGMIPGGNLIVELAIPDGTAVGNTFFIGTNAAGEAKPGYMRAPTCNVIAPTAMNAVGAAQSPPLGKADLIMTVTGLKF